MDLVATISMCRQATQKSHCCSTKFLAFNHKNSCQTGYDTLIMTAAIVPNCEAKVLKYILP
uniref:Uncharacterized protein n=1 Tax=Rhizophora mucronata TaxID=61149 RepID=A0A2P2R264_RHIMU